MGSDNYELLLSTFKDIITDDYVFLDLPYYSNVGDVLIWEASLQILKNIRHRCLYYCSVETYRKPRIKQNTILLFSGGGNFGDLWEKHQHFRHRIMEDFPDNPIVQLPQSVWFEDENNLKKDAQYYNRHRGSVILCARDKQSFDIFCKNYPNAKTLLLPDLVLSLDINKVLKRNKIKTIRGNGVLYFKRDDKEFVSRNLNIKYDAVGDWPCRSHEIACVKRYNNLMRQLKKFRIPGFVRLKIANLYYRYIIKDAYLCDGINFLMPFREVYATRLHAAILAWLIGKEVYMIDNSYHKCSGVYDIWMKEYENIHMI